MRRNRLITSVLITLLVAVAAVAAPKDRVKSERGGGGDENDFVAGEIIVKLLDAADLAAVAAEYGLDPTPLDQVQMSAAYRLRVLDPTASIPDLAEALALDPQMRVVYAQPNYVKQAPESRARVVWASSGTPAEYQGQWAPDVIGLDAAFNINRGAGQIVAVLDTGIDLAHPEFVNRLVPGYDFVDDDADPSEVGSHPTNAGFGHGTHVAGIVALAAPDAKIMPVRVLDPEGEGADWIIAEALLWAADPDGDPSTNDGATVINLSLGSQARSALLRDVIEAVTSAECVHDSPGHLPCLFPEGTGPVIVAAAGNRGDDEREYPAGDGRDGSIAVGASTAADRLATYSNRGSWVDVAAPGDGIYSTVPGGGYASWSGTSMATPFVAAQAALIRAAMPTLTTTNVVRRIIQTCDRIPGDVRDRIDVARSLGPSRLR